MVDYISNMGRMADLVSAPVQNMLAAQDNAQQNARRNQLFAMQQAESQQQMQAQQDQATEAQHQQQARVILAAGRAGNQQARAYALKMLSEKAPPEIAAGMAQADPEQAWPHIESALAQYLGEKPMPQQTPYEIKTQPGPFGSQVITDGSRFQIIEPPRQAGGGRASAAGSAPAASMPSNAKPRPVEAATKLSALDEAISSIPTLRTTLTGAAAPARRQLLIEAATNLPGSKGREFRQAMTFAVEGALRAMTGAAAPESEVKRYMSMFMPSILDSPEAQAEKLDRLERWITNARAQAGGTPSQPPPTQGGELQIGTIEDGYRYKGGDPALESSWEPAQ